MEVDVPQKPSNSTRPVNAANSKAAASSTTKTAATKQRAQVSNASEPLPGPSHNRTGAARQAEVEVLEDSDDSEREVAAQSTTKLNPVNAPVSSATSAVKGKGKSVPPPPSTSKSAASTNGRVPVSASVENGIAETNSDLWAERSQEEWRLIVEKASSTFASVTQRTGRSSNVPSTTSESIAGSKS